ncbi:hypothetical protein H4W81_002410 [Nonomuraea africana]|uniref:Uncharacterized protein n=1 Tax=Nonomuraea africana TaxID=46171 RepID=A0ABR9KCU5_9ACTN|nr:hypothetical protein [Nonomuraea africana]
MTPASITWQDAQHVRERAAVAIELVEGLAEPVFTIDAAEGCWLLKPGLDA